jgi:GAF domain-containing protein
MSVSDLEESLRSTTRLARLAFSAGAASIFRYHADGDRLVFEAASGAGEDQIIGMEVPAGSGIVGWVLGSGEPILVRDVSIDQRFDLNMAAQTGYIPQTIMAMPLIRKGEVIGVMEVLDPKLDSLSDIAALDLLAEIAGQAAMLISLMPEPDRAAAGGVLRTAVAGHLEMILDRLHESKIADFARIVEDLAGLLG